MQLHGRCRPRARRYQAKQCPTSAVQGRFVHLVQSAIHEAREITFDEKAAADDEAHQAADCALGSQGHQRAKIAISELPQRPSRKQKLKLFDHEVRLLVGGLRARRDGLGKSGARTGGAIADRKNVVVQCGLQGGAHGELVDAVCL
jgi:hypothetical protein